MAMMGISEIAIVFAMLFGGGVGIPLSLPPAEPDKLLDAMTPEQATFYSNWAGIGEIQADSGNATEELFAEPEIQEFIRKAEAAARDGVVPPYVGVPAYRLERSERRSPPPRPTPPFRSTSTASCE